MPIIVIPLAARAPFVLRPTVVAFGVDVDECKLMALPPSPATGPLLLELLV